MGTFLLCLLLALHSVVGVTPTDGSASSSLGSPWGAVLCCDLAEQEHSQARCHISLHSPPLTSLHHLPRQGVVCLNILCWVDGNLENVICNLKVYVGQSDTSRPVAIGLQRLPSQFCSDNVTDSGAQGKCEGEDIRTCSVALHSANSTASLMISMSDGSSSVQSPVMDIVPLHFLKPDPPLDVQYHMTTEGELRLSWSHALPRAEHFVCDIRYSSNTLHSWTHMDAEGASGASLKGLSVGLNYTVQVRCKSPGSHGVWSDWSCPLYIYLNEVSYLPERLFTNTGSNVTIYCIFNNQSHSAKNAVWWLSYQKVPESQYSVVSDRVSSVTLLNVKPLKQRGYDILHCCQREGEKSLCSFPYAQIYVKDISVAISCEVNGDLTAMTCTWNTSQWAEVRCLYQHSLLCEEEVELPPAEECPVLGRDSKSCRLQPLFLTSCYIMWVEGRKKEGTIKSPPIYILPMDLVKPHPPYDLGATVMPDAYLSIWWKRPELPVYELQFEVRYSANRDDTLQKVIRSVFSQSAVVPAVDPCMVYTIQVRCRRLAGPGFWSDWSSPFHTAINNIKAPEHGPDFWRVLQEYPKLNQTNVTLLFKVSQSDGPLCCVEGLTVKHQTSRGSVWTENLGRVSIYTFPWTEEAHTVTVLAHNALGSSTKNSNMTLTRHTKLQSVHSFSSLVVNSSCVALSWTLFPNSSAPSSYVLEWSSQSRSRQQGQQGAAVEWVRIPPHSHAYHLHGTFALEGYQFILYPVFENGEGEPIYAKEDRGRPRGDQAAYMLLLIIVFLSVVLFVTLAISQNQMRKLVWKDVPNPNNCSWAQGLDFRKAETIESLFRHPERLISCPLLLESETISEAVIVEKTGSTVQSSERDQALNKAVLGDEAPSLSPGVKEDGPQEPLDVQQTSLSPDTPDGSAQSRISYAMVLFPGTPGLLYKQQESLSSSSDEGNFSANNSDISGSFPGGLWELENPPSNDSDPRHSCSYNSAEEFSETSDAEDEVLDGTGAAKELYYLGMTSQSEEEEEDKQDEDEQEEEAVARFPREDAQERPLESSPLLGRWGPRVDRTDPAAKNPPLYVPQFRTSSRKSQQVKTKEWSGVESLQL